MERSSRLQPPAEAALKPYTVGPSDAQGDGVGNALRTAYNAHLHDLPRELKLLLDRLH